MPEGAAATLSPHIIGQHPQTNRELIVKKMGTNLIFCDFKFQTNINAFHISKIPMIYLSENSEYTSGRFETTYKIKAFLEKTLQSF